MTAWIWMFMGLLGFIALAAAMSYGQYKTSHPPHTRREDRKRDKATRELYEGVEHDRQARTNE
jgi:hypothetical protein